MEYKIFFKKKFEEKIEMGFCFPFKFFTYFSVSNAYYTF